MPWVAAERPAVFNAYQQTQTPRVEKAMMKAKYVASFVARKSNRAMFVGLYRMNGGTTITRQECMQKPESIELVALGMKVPRALVKAHVVRALKTKYGVCPPQ